jgi:xanthine dehydrogenase YagS FAD-binding subunit
MTRLIAIIEHPVIEAQYSLLAQAASQVASPQLRHTSTIAGNLCQRPRCWYFRNRDIVCLKKGGSMCWAVEGDNRYYHAILEGGPATSSILRTWHRHSSPWMPRSISWVPTAHGACLWKNFL